MESTHDLDFVLWLLGRPNQFGFIRREPTVTVEPISGSLDVMFTTVTMDNGVTE
jgi:hypothetical protein